LKNNTKYLAILLSIALLAIGCGDMPNQVQTEVPMLTSTANISIPDGAVLESATFYIYAHYVSNQTVNVHRVTAAWDESTVSWNSFASSYDPAIVGSFTVTQEGYQEVDITPLVQGWLDGTYENYGLLLEQGATAYTYYPSSEFDDITKRPALELCYNLGGQNCVDIKRGVNGDVADAYLLEQLPTYKSGESNELYTGLVYDTEYKVSVFQFDYEGVAEDDGCTRPLWWWKVHSGYGCYENEVSQCLPIWLGDEGGEGSILVSDSTDAIQVFSRFVYGTPWNGITRLYAQLLAAKLNVAAGASDADVADIIAAADEFLAEHDWEDWRSLSRSTKWMIMGWSFNLFRYNIGWIGPGHCGC